MTKSIGPGSIAEPVGASELRSGSASPSVRASGGEMGAAIRAFDWSRTPLGAIEDWPLSLRTAANIGLSSRFAILVWWGPEFTMIYNDAYREIIAAKHPAALGQPGKECWNEIWDIIGPMLENVVSTGEPTWSDDLQLLLERHGYPEECYFTFSYSPLWDEEGKVGGVFTPVAETTERVIGERRLRTLRDLAARSGEPRSVDQACNAVAAALATNPYDIPFAMLYLVDGATRQPHLVASAGIEADGPESSRLVDVDCTEPWPLGDVIRTGKQQRVDDVMQRCGARPSSVWGVSPSTAVVLPVTLPGQSTPTAVLVLAVSPRKRFDSAYETFFNLIAGQVAAALAEALAYEEERRRAEALAELDRVKTAFFCNVSHEFRTPLTLLLGPLEDLLAKPLDALPAADREQLDIVHRNGLRLLKLVNTLLDFSRIEGSRLHAVYEPTDLAVFTAELASTFRSAIERAGMRLIVDCPPLAAPAYVDRDMWEKIVLNLMSNAFKFTLAGEIAVALRMAGTNIELSVRDTGAGIPADQVPHLFERFHRVPGTQARTHEGTGIGLALVHELVKLHGGSVSVESVCGRGSTFAVTIRSGHAHLPADHISDAQPSRPRGAAPYVDEALRWIDDDVHGLGAPAQPENGERVGRILLADDNSDMRAYIRRLLSDRYTVETVADGVAALAAARTQLPDLILTDVMMPRMDGLTLLRELRADARTSTIPVIILSARAGDDLRVQGLEARANDYLVKPFSARELIARIDTHLEMSRLRHEATRFHLAAIVESSDDAIISKTLDGTITSWNQGAERLFGYSAAEVIGRPMALLIAPDRVKEEPEILARLRRGERIDHYETVRLHKDGRPINVLVTVSPVKDHDGVIIGASNITHDITEHKRTEEALREADRQKDRFLAVLGHELRNPLAPIRNAVQLLRRARLQDPLLERARDMIDRQATHMTRLIDDLLDISRITWGKIALRPRRVNVTDVVTAVANDHQAAFASGGVTLQVDVPSNPLWISADATRLSQAVGNVLLNAVKFTDPGGRVRLYVQTESGQAVIGVKDTGIGMDHDAIDRVFEPFNQLDRLGHRGAGLGLGLALAKEIVELHGGAVQACSDGIGHGSEFTLRLPLDTAPAGVMSVSTVDAPPASTPCRVLVIEDNVDTAESMKLLLSFDGHDVTVAHSGADAVKMAREGGADVIVCDIGLPGDMDGYAVARAIRQDPIASVAYLIALTGYGQEDDQRRARAAGFDLHLTKPIDFPALQHVLASVAAAPSARRGSPPP